MNLFGLDLSQYLFHVSIIPLQYCSFVLYYMFLFPYLLWDNLRLLLETPCFSWMIYVFINDWFAGKDCVSKINQKHFKHCVVVEKTEKTHFSFSKLFSPQAIKTMKKYQKYEQLSKTRELNLFLLNNITYKSINLY